jgi:hypothetical protein
MRNIKTKFFDSLIRKPKPRLSNLPSSKKVPKQNLSEFFLLKAMSSSSGKEGRRRFAKALKIGKRILWRAVNRKPVWAALFLILMLVGNLGGFELIGEARNLAKKNISASEKKFEKLPRVEIEPKKIFARSSQFEKEQKKAAEEKNETFDFQVNEDPEFEIEMPADVSAAALPPETQPVENNLSVDNAKNADGADNAESGIDLNSIKESFKGVLSGEAVNQPVPKPAGIEASEENEENQENSGNKGDSDVMEKEMESPLSFLRSEAGKEFAKLSGSIVEVKPLQKSWLGNSVSKWLGWLGAKEVNAAGLKIIKAEVLDAAGNVNKEIQTLIEESANPVKIKVLKPERSFKPGKYSLRVEMLSSDETQVLTSTQDFTWGVLAINVNKSVYSPGETAKLQFGVLDENGKMVCDAKLKLEVRNERWEARDELSTEDRTIKVNEDICRSRAFTLEPDYEAEYKVGEWGIYEMTLTAETANGTHTIKDSFEVSNAVAFDVERVSATRINPKNKYPVIFDIVANQDFEGEIREEVPAGFEIEKGGESDGEDKPAQNSPSIEAGRGDWKKFDDLKEGEKSKTLIWNVDLKKGDKVKLGYVYDAPDESPQFYLLGPLTFKSQIPASSADRPSTKFQANPSKPNSNDQSGEIVFQEARQWQIALDSPNGTGILVYDEDGANNQPPHYRTWDGSDLSSEGNLLQTEGTADVNHTIIECSPTRNECIRGALTDQGYLVVQIWNGDTNTWGYGGNAPTSGRFTTGIGTTNDIYRGFDIAYEATSGDAMVVYENSSTANKTIKYRTWDGTNWSNEQTLDYSAVAEGGANDVTVWVELEGDYTTNNILLAWQDKTGLGFYGACWNGSAWQDIALINGAGVLSTKQGFDIAWEGLSHKGKIYYATGTTAGASTYTVGSGWSADSGMRNPGVAEQWIRIAGSPNNNYIAVIINAVASTSSADIYVDMWNGTDWTTVSDPTGDTDINNNGYAQPMDVAWEQASGADRALFVWRDGTTSETSLRYMVYDISVGAYRAIDDDDVCNLTGTHTDQTVTSLANAENSNGPCTGLGNWEDEVSGVDLNPDPGSRKIMIVAEDKTADLKPQAQLWNGDDYGTWLTQTSNMGGFETDLSTGNTLSTSYPTKPYDFAFRRSEATISISGSIYQSNESSLDTTSYSVYISVNNGTPVAATVPGDGTYSASGISASSGYSIAVYIYNHSNDANAFTVTDGTTNITGLNLIVGKVTVGSNNGSTATTNTNICNQSSYPAAGDTLISCSGTNLTIASNAEFHILTGAGNKYDTNSGTLTTQGTGGLHVDDNASATLTSATTVAGDVAIDSGATLVAAGSNTVGVAGNWTNNGTFTANSSTVTFNGSSSQTINGSSSTTFNNLSISNSSAAVSANTNTAVNGTLTIGSGAILSPAAAVVISGTGTLTGSGTAQVTRTSATPDFLSQYTIANKTLTNLTVAYVSDSPQTISAVNYGNLLSSGAGARTLASSGTIGISGTFTVGTNSYTVTGSTVDYNGASQTVGAINYNNLTLSGSGTKTLQTGTTSIAGNLTLSGTASATLVGNLTVGGQVTVNTGATLGLGSSGYTLTLSGSGTGTSRPLYMNGGTLNEGTNSTVLFTGTSASDIQNETYYNLTFAPTSGSPTYTFLGATTVMGKMTVGNGSNAVTLATNNQSLDLNGDFEIKASGIFTAPSSASFTIAGNYTNSGTLNHSNGTITFDSGSTGRTINTGGTGSGKVFYDVVFNSSSGGWTIQTNDMKVAHNLSITDIANSADSWTLDTGRTLEVDGTYTITGTETAYTKWTGSTFYLNGTSQTIGSKTQAAETYGTLQIGANTHIRMWQSTAAAFNVDSTGSLYSMDHANVDGDLYIWGDYNVPNNSTDYWNYAEDFDGASGANRQVDVRIDPSAKVTVGSGETLQIIGTSPNRTTVSRQGSSGGFELVCNGGTINIDYTDFDYLDGPYGLNIQAGSTVTKIDHSTFENLVSSGSGTQANLTVATSVIGTGTPSLTLTGNSFTLGSGHKNAAVIGSNVTGYWTFSGTNGEANDWNFTNSADEDDPGMLRWDDSTSSVFSLSCAGAAAMPDYTLGDSNNYNLKDFTSSEKCTVTDISYDASWSLTLYSTNLAGSQNNLSNANIKLSTNGDPSSAPTVVSSSTGITEPSTNNYSLDTVRTVIQGSPSASGTYDVQIRSRLESLNTLYAETGDTATLTFTLQ